MSRLDDAIRDAESREIERVEVVAGEPLRAEIPQPTKDDLAEANAEADAIRAGVPRIVSTSRPYVQPLEMRHPDSTV